MRKPSAKPHTVGSASQALAHWRALGLVRQIVRTESGWWLCHREVPESVLLELERRGEIAWSGPETYDPV